MEGGTGRNKKRRLTGGFVEEKKDGHRKGMEASLDKGMKTEKRRERWGVRKGEGLIEEYGK